ANSYVSIPGDNAALQLNHDLTIAAWIKTAPGAQKQNFVSKYDFSGAESGYLFQVLPSGVLNVHVGGNNLASGSRDAPDTKAVNDGQWHHVAAVVALNQNVRFYVDGQLTSTQPLAAVASRNG